MGLKKIRIAVLLLLLKKKSPCDVARCRIAWIASILRKH
jgi:hypothetical protein